MQIQQSAIKQSKKNITFNLLKGKAGREIVKKSSSCAGNNSTPVLMMSWFLQGRSLSFSFQLSLPLFLLSVSLSSSRCSLLSFPLLWFFSLQLLLPRFPGSLGSFLLSTHANLSVVTLTQPAVKNLLDFSAVIPLS